jgi:hypothetical protein
MPAVVLMGKVSCVGPKPRWDGRVNPKGGPKTHVHRSRTARANALADPGFLASAAGESWIGALAENFPAYPLLAGPFRLLVAQEPQRLGREDHRCPL